MSRASRKSSLALVVVTTSALLLAAAAYAGSGRSVSIGRAGAGAPSGSPAAERARAARALYEALLRHPFPDAKLPVGYTSARIGAGTLTRQQRRMGDIGAIAVSVSGPDASDGVAYIVRNGSFAQNVRDIQAQLGNGRFAPAAGFALPAWLARVTAGSGRSGAAPGEAYLCIVIVDNVAVIGISAASGRAGSGNAQAATALARAGVARLQEIVSQPAR